MNTNKFQAVAAAFLLSTAALGAGALLATGPAYAQGLRPEVGTPLQAAEAAAAKGDYKGAMDDVNKAEAVSNKTSAESSAIAQVKAYVGAKSGDISLGGAAAVKTKLTNDYNAKNYSAVISDGDQLQKAGALEAADAQVVAQSYYLSGNKAGCVKYVKGLGNADETTLQLQMKCAFDANDDADQRDALEQLVAKTGKADYWTQLLKMADSTKGLTDHQSLDIYRIKFLTGTLASKDDYINMAQLDLQLGFPQEAAAVMDKGTASGLLSDDRSKKLQALAKQQAAQAASGQAAALAGAKDGDAMIKVAEQQAGAGDAKDAVTTAKSAMAKSPKDKDQAAIVLGWAQVASGQGSDAVKTLKADTGDGNGPMIAHLYSIYAAHPAGAAAAAPAEAPAKKKK
jgi:hypothetical protein